MPEDENWITNEGYEWKEPSNDVGTNQGNENIEQTVEEVRSKPFYKTNFNGFLSNESELSRNQHRQISDRIKYLEESLKEAELIDLEQSKKLFGLGAYIGRKKTLEGVRDISADLDLYKKSYEKNIEEIYFILSKIREEADIRQYMVTHGGMTAEEASCFSNEDVLKRLKSYMNMIETKRLEANEIYDHIRSGRMTLNQASSEGIDEELSRARAEKQRKIDKNYDLGEEALPIHLCFVRRSDFLPEIVDGTVFVRTPFTSLNDPTNTHFPRVSSHWAVNSVAADPGVYGRYGTKITFVCERDKFIEANGLPKRMTENDTYWLHDVALPKETKIYIIEGFATEEQIEELRNAGMDIKLLNGNEAKNFIDNEIRDWGYTGYRDISGFAKKNGIEYGRHDGEPADIATRRVNDVLCAIEEYQAGKVQSSIIEELYYKMIVDIRDTINTNKYFEAQLEKIEKILKPFVQNVIGKELL